MQHRIVLLGCLGAALTLGLLREAHAQLLVTSGRTAAQLAAILAPGVAITNPSRSPDNAGAGEFSGGTSLLALDHGIVLGTGRVVDAVGPNDDNPVDGTDTTNGSHPQLATLFDVPEENFIDASALSFQFTCPVGTGRVKLDFVLASEEYGPAGLPDAVGIFVDGSNAATVPGSPDAISVETISPGETPFLFRDNATCPGGVCPFNLEAEGFSTPLTAQAAVGAGAPSHTLDIVVADSEDALVDSWLFLSAFACLPHACGDGALGPGEQCDDGNTASGDCCSSTCQNEAQTFSITVPASLAVDGQVFSSGSLIFDEVTSYSEVWGRTELASLQPVTPVSVNLGAATTSLFELPWTTAPSPLDAPQVVRIEGRFVPGDGSSSASFTSLVGPVSCPVGQFDYLPAALSRDVSSPRIQLVNLGLSGGAQDNSTLEVYSATPPDLLEDLSPELDGNFSMANGVDASWYVGYVLDAPSPPPPPVPVLGNQALWLGAGLIGAASLLLHRRRRLDDLAA